MSAHASVVVHRRVAWNETDAAGHNHFSAVFRWIEETEHELYRQLGFDSAMIDRIPRVHIEADYRQRLYFGQWIAVEVAVASVGRASCEFTFTVRTEDDQVAAEGRYVIVHVSSTSTGATPWPEGIRTALTTDRKFAVRAGLVEN